MATEPDSLVLQHLRRFDGRLDGVVDEMPDVEAHSTAVEGLAAVNLRLDRAIKTAGGEEQGRYEDFDSCSLYAGEEATAFAGRNEWRAACGDDLRPPPAFRCETSKAEPAYLRTCGAEARQVGGGIDEKRQRHTTRLQAGKDLRL